MSRNKPSHSSSPKASSSKMEQYHLLKGKIEVYDDRLKQQQEALREQEYLLAEARLLHQAELHCRASDLALQKKKFLEVPPSFVVLFFGQRPLLDAEVVLKSRYTNLFVLLLLALGCALLVRFVGLIPLLGSLGIALYISRAVFPAIQRNTQWAHEQYDEQIDSLTEAQKEVDIALETDSHSSEMILVSRTVQQYRNHMNTVRFQRDKAFQALQELQGEILVEELPEQLRKYDFSMFVSSLEP